MPAPVGIRTDYSAVELPLAAESSTRTRAEDSCRWRLFSTE